MKCNNEELSALASQTSQNFDREGVLVIRERQEGFFRRSEGYSIRWCRLRGNLLFYLRGPEPWDEPFGLIVLGQHKVSVAPQDENGHWPFQLVWENGVYFNMGTLLQCERTLWLKAMASAPYETLTQRITELQQQLNDTRTMIDLKKYHATNKIITDFNELPVCEMSLSCDNLICDANGNPPSPFVTVFVLSLAQGICVRYGCTEVVEKCSNPNFLRTIMFRASDSINGDVTIRILVYNMREIVTQTGVPIGSVTMRMSHIQEAQRLRVPLLTVEDRIVGFVTINGWTVEPTTSLAVSPTHPNPERHSIDLSPALPAHRRSQSLPPRMGLKLQYPAYPLLFRQNFTNPVQATYRFHSGLGGDITVHEALAEPRFGFSIPVQLVEIFLLRELEVRNAIMEFAELSKCLTPRLIDLVGNHITVMKMVECGKMAEELAMPHSIAIAELNAAKDNMMKYSVFYKPSIKKVDEIPEETGLAYVPINLHIQRMWAYNDTLNKRGFHDVITVGAFSAHTHTTAKPGGLIKLLQQAKDISTRNAEMTANSNRLEEHFDHLRAMNNVQRTLVAHMDSALLLLHNGLIFHDMWKSMKGIRENLKRFLDMWNLEATEEPLSKLGWHKKRIDEDNAEARRAYRLGLQARLERYPNHSARAVAAMVTVAALIAPSMADDGVITTTIEAVDNGADEVGTDAAAHSVNNPAQAVPEPADGEKSAANKAKPAITTPDSMKFADTAPATAEIEFTPSETAKLAVTTPEPAKLEVTTDDASKPEPANLDQQEVFANLNSLKKTLDVVKTCSEIELFRTYEHDCENKALAWNTVSESDLRSSSEHKVNNQSLQNDHGKNGINIQHEAERKVPSTSGVYAAGAAGTDGDLAPEEAASTSGSSVAATSENHGDEQAAGTSGNIDAVQAANNSGSRAAGHSGKRTKRQPAACSGTNSYSATASSSGSTVSVQNASKPNTSGKSNRGKPRGTKNNRPPKTTKQARKEAEKAQQAAAVPQSDRTLKMRVSFKNASSLEQVTAADNLVFENDGGTKKGKRNRRGPIVLEQDPAVRECNLDFFKKLKDTLHEILDKLFVSLNTIIVKGFHTPAEFEDTRILMELTVMLLDEIRKWNRMAHAAIRIVTDNPAWSAEYSMLRTRRDICFTQAITAASAGVLSWVSTTSGEMVAKTVKSGLGPLLGFEGLLSMHAQESTMWGDMVVAIEDLHTVTYKFVPVTVGSPVVPQVSGARGALVIEVPISGSLYARFKNDMNTPPLFTLTAVFFNVGINDKASLAEALGDDKPQFQSNKDNFQRIFKYYLKYSQLFPQDPIDQLRASSHSKPLEEVMENLRSAIQRRTSKNVEVLHLAAQATRLMHGVRFTSCKSAKDRTGMSVTLEQSGILSDEYHLADHERKRALDIMRSEGCRRENTLKNTGQTKYAFTKQQVRALPEEYRPPLGSYGVGET